MISIVLATYNGAQYLCEQLESVLAQTIQDFELVVSDDCSSDETWQILQNYAQKDNRIHLYKNECNLGFKTNFEKAISFCKGEFIALCDQDDIWTSNHLEILLNNIGNNMVSCGNSELIDSEGRKLGLSLKQLEAFDKVPEGDMEKALSFLLFRNPIQGASMLIKRVFFNKALPIPEGVRYHDAWFAIFSCFYGGISYTSEIVNQYRMHGNNVTGYRVKRESRFKHFLNCIYKNNSYDRMDVLSGIEDKLINMPHNQKDVVNSCKCFVLRNRTIGGRIRNAFIRLYYYRIIYCI